jgi:Uma2 family endonuclease
MCDEGSITVPSSVEDLDSFRAWVHSEALPEKQRVFFLDGEVWLDMAKEQIFWHVALKTCFARVLSGFVEEADAGYFLTDGVLYSSVRGRLSGNPDGIFISYEAVESGRVKLIKGKEGGYVEVKGTADTVLEIVNDSSVAKDTVKLRKLYGRAQVPEYWLVDARGDKLDFDILRWTKRGYVQTPLRDGWLNSGVFGREFRLSRTRDKLGNPKFKLEIR